MQIGLQIPPRGTHCKLKWSLHAASKSAFQIQKKQTLKITQKEDAGVQVPCLVLANVCNTLTMPVVATKCLVYLLNTVGKCRACRWMGWDCALKGAPTAAFGRAAFLCRFKFPVCFHIAYIYIDTKRKKKISLLSSLTLIQPLQILLCCATVALCVTENTQKPSMTCTG